MLKIYTKYDYPNHLSPGINFSPQNNPADRSLTNQADLDASDINKIMAKFEKTGVLIDLSGNTRTPMYGDFTEIKNYHEMLIGVRNVERAFDLLPAKVKNRFENDPQQLINFLDDPKNNEEAIQLGLIEKPEDKPQSEPKKTPPPPSAEAKPANPVS